MKHAFRALRTGATPFVVSLLLLPALVEAFQTPAQEDPADRRLGDLSLEELMEIKIDEVYTASRFVQKISEAPSSVTVVTAEEIRRSGYRTLADVLRGMRGTYVTNDRNYSYLGVRGFGLPADYNNRVLFLVDGHRVNDNVYDAVLIGNEFILDVDTIERIEFIRGPSSSLYGSNAFFAVVNIMTKKGRQLNGAEVAGSVGGFGSYRTRATYGKRYDNGLEVLLSASLFKSQGVKNLYYPEFDDPATNNGYASGADGEYAYNLLAKVSYHDFSLEAAFVAREKTIPTGAYSTIFPSRDTKTWDSLGFVNLNYHHDFEGVVDVEARVHVNRSAYRGDYPYDASGTVPPTIVTFKDTYLGEWWGAELLLSRSFWNGRLKATLGSEYRDNFHQNQKSIDDTDPEFVYQDTKEESDVEALFGQADLSLTDELRLNAGLRMDSYEQFGELLSPRVGLIYSPAESTHLKLLFGRAFRAPSAYETSYANVGIQKINPDLKEETITTYELVWEQDLAAEVQLVTTAYAYKCNDLITLEVDPADGVKWFRNVDEVRTLGAEMELRAKLDGGFEGTLSYSYQDTENARTHEWLTNSPHHLAKLNLTAPLAWKQSFANLELQYVGQRRSVAGPRIDDYLLTNLTFTAAEIAKGLDLSASVYNLFNVKYHDPGGLEHRQNQIEQDGLSFRVALVYRF